MPPTYFNFACDVVECWARERPNALALWCVGEDGSEHKFSFEQLAKEVVVLPIFSRCLGFNAGTVCW